MSVSTKTGDQGMTSLYGGKRVSKDDIRVSAYGTVDELSAEIGLLITFCTNSADISFLTQIQKDLFTVAGYLATDRNNPRVNTKCILPETQITSLEEQIHAIEGIIPPFKNFILPGGCKASAVCHVCRTVCRRAERCIVSLHNAEGAEEDAPILRYINRLSDYFFVLARKLNADAGVEDTTL